MRFGLADWPFTEIFPLLQAFCASDRVRNRHAISSQMSRRRASTALTLLTLARRENSVKLSSRFPSVSNRRGRSLWQGQALAIWNGATSLQGVTGMSIVDRIKNICLTPNTEWPVIANEPSSTGSLIAGYVAPLAAVSAIAGFIGVTPDRNEHVFRGHLPDVAVRRARAGGVDLHRRDHRRRAGRASSSTRSRRRSAARQNSARAMKVAVYSFTPAWVAGVLRIVPGSRDAGDSRRLLRLLPALPRTASLDESARRRKRPATPS